MLRSSVKGRRAAAHQTLSREDCRLQAAPRPRSQLRTQVILKGLSEPVAIRHFAQTRGEVGACHICADIVGDEHLAGSMSDQTGQPSGATKNRGKQPPTSGIRMVAGIRKQHPGLDACFSGWSGVGRVPAAGAHDGITTDPGPHSSSCGATVRRGSELGKPPRDQFLLSGGA